MQKSEKKPESFWEPLKKRWRATQRFLKAQQVELPGRINALSGILFIAGLLTVIMLGPQDFSGSVRIRNGVVESDVLAPRDFTMEDAEATEQIREKAEAQINPIFDYDVHLRTQTVSALSQELEHMSEKFTEAAKERFGRPELPKNQLTSPATQAFLQEIVPQLRDEGKLVKDLDLLMMLANNNFNLMLREELGDAINYAMSGYIYAGDDIEQATVRRITVRNLATGERTELRGRELIGLSAAHKLFADEISNIRYLSVSDRERVITILKPLIVSNLRYSQTLTDAARATARNQLSPIQIDFRQNQIIARHGDPVTPFTLRVLNTVKTLQQADSYRRRAIQFIGLFIIMVGLMLALRRLFERTTAFNQRLGSARAFSLFSFTLIVQIALIRLGLELSGHFATTVNGLASPIRAEFLIPFAGATLITAFLLDVTAAQVCALVVCLLTAMISRGDLGLTIYAALSGTAAAYGVERYRHRNSITRAGTIVGVINALAIIIVLLISNQSTSFSIFFYNIGYGVFGGLLTAAFVSLLIPINESLFDILTDVKLLELANMDLPLLRDLAMRAPGTQQHSAMVGSLAEAAAEAIDANALLVRIGCYYHDVGKMMAPDMFIENQAGKPNPHDIMDPKRSASVITGHVRKGIIMAREAGLPEQLIDLIPQHHGTRRLHYFYNKALDGYSRTGEPVNEDHYRYPGPKPQTREAAIVMLSDCAEAAARTLDEPTPENLRAIIKKITDDVIADGQLEECELTMREFNEVRECLIQTLGNIYHNRIKYPGFNEDEEENLTANSDTAPLITKTETKTEEAHKEIKEPKPAKQQMAVAAGANKTRTTNEDSQKRNGKAKSKS